MLFSRLRIRYFLIIMLMGLGCASTARKERPTTIDESQFRKGLEYSRRIYGEPIDILKDEPHPLPSSTEKPHSTASSGGKRSPNPPHLANGFAVQLASFQSESNANKFLIQQQENDPNLRLKIRRHQGLWRVLLGYFASRAEAERTRNKVKSLGYNDAWIIRF
jgi:cell division septation protein DedD